MFDKYEMPSILGASAERRFHVMAKPGGSVRNLDCPYCYYLSKETLPGGPGAGRIRQTDAVLFADVDAVGR